ncbi:MAG: rRNA pseudouridine synthase [Gemmataceae bacterium]|nr:rRNA pseudouridine synthase [Gemmataceae bacterium]
MEKATEEKRLNQYLAHAGVASRRHCENLILRGRVTVDGEVVRELGTRVHTGQTVAVDGQELQGEILVYWILNKPQGYLCTNHDPSQRPLAGDFMTHVKERLFLVGRLDEDSEGLLLFTNDGSLAQKITHPRFGVEKVYHCQVAGFLKREEMAKLEKGVWSSEGRMQAKRVRPMKRQGESLWLEITLCEGKNREIRRMLAALGHKVLKLKRVSIGPIRMDRLPKGKSRRLKPNEVAQLQRVFSKPKAPGH